MTTLKQIIDTVDETVSLEQIKSFIPNEEAYKNAPRIVLYVNYMRHSFTPLQYAIIRANTALVAYFLDQCQADINQKDLNSRAPTIYATSTEHTDIVAILVARGTELNATNSRGWTTLHYAASQGRIESIRPLLDAGADTEARTEDDGCTPLMLAARNGHVNVITALAARGADFGARDNNGSTALIFAVHYGRLEAVETLLKMKEYGAAINLEAKSALHIAAARGHEKIVVALLNAGANIEARTEDDGYTPLILAARNGHVNVITALAARGARLDARDDRRQTALGMAAANRNLEAFKMLLALGASVQDLNPAGFSPEMAAEWAKARRTDALYNGHITGIHNLEDINQERFKCFYTKNGFPGRLMRNIDTLGETDLGKLLTDLVAMLVARGTELNATDCRGWTALHHAAYHGLIESIHPLLDAGADIEAGAGYIAGYMDGWTALHFAAARGREKIVAALLNAGANIEAGTKDSGSTPLILAASNGHANVITALAARGAHLDARNNRPQTALGRAAANRQLEAFKMLLALGASVQDLNPAGFSPEMAAEWAKARRTDKLYKGFIRGIDNLEDINQERFKCFYTNSGLTERLMQHIDTLGETDLGKFLNAMMPLGGLLHLAHPGSFPSSAPHSLMSASEQKDSLPQETGKKRSREDQSPPDTILEGGSVVQKRPALGQPTLSGLHASALTSKNASYPNK